MRETQNRYDYIKCFIEKDIDNVPLFYIAEMWWFEQGNEIPHPQTEEHTKMYETWVENCFLVPED